MFTSLKSTIPKVLKRIDQNSKVYNLSVESVFGDLVREIYGKGVDDFIKPVVFKDNTLFIKCSNSSIASEIQLSKGDILQGINKKLKHVEGVEVKNLAFI